MSPLSEEEDDPYSPASYSQVHTTTTATSASNGGNGGNGGNGVSFGDNGSSDDLSDHHRGVWRSDEHDDTQ